MKLYTDEQVRKAIALAQDCDSDCGGVYFLYETPDGIMEELTPIELPSDEEIDNKIAEELSGFLESEWVYEYNDGFQHGAKWIISHIKQQS